MPIELSKYLSKLDRAEYEVDGAKVTCWFGPRRSGRRQLVRVREVDDGIRMEATIATARTLDSIRMHDDPSRWAWRRNKVRHIVGFRVDGQKRLTAEAVAPSAGLTQEEFEIYLRSVAAEADRMELVLTGQDLE